MKVIYHLGAHCTDEQKLVNCLLANAADLARQGIVIPDPARYRSFLRDTIGAMRGAPSSRETEEAMLDAVMDEDHADRVVFSHDSFICLPRKAIGMGMLYPTAAQRTRWLTQVLPSHQSEFALAIRNPATFIPALLQRANDVSYDELMTDSDPMGLRWSDVVTRIQNLNPDVPITVWCDEDTPLIWPEVLRAVAGHDAKAHLAGETDLLSTIMSSEGLKRMQDYLASHPTDTVSQRRRIVAAFLDKFALSHEIEVELDLPGWDEEYVEELTRRYDEDVFMLARMPGVTFIAP